MQSFSRPLQASQTGESGATGEDEMAEAARGPDLGLDAFLQGAAGCSVQDVERHFGIQA